MAKHIIYDHYFRQYSIQEIAARDNKSRQAINKCPSAFETDGHLCVEWFC